MYIWRNAAPIDFGGSESIPDMGHSRGGVDKKSRDGQIAEHQRLYPLLNNDISV